MIRIVSEPLPPEVRAELDETAPHFPGPVTEKP
jgi:hypothetical protein